MRYAAKFFVPLPILLQYSRIPDLQYLLVYTAVLSTIGYKVWGYIPAVTVCSVLFIIFIHK